QRMGLYDRDYMRRPQGGGGRNRGWVGLGILGCLALVAWWWAHGNNFRPADVEGPKPKLLEARTVDLGRFEVVSGEVAVCDPGYTKDEVLRGAIATKVRNVLKGEWQAQAILHVIDTPNHVRCGELLAFPTSLPVPPTPDWKEIHADIGVD